MSKNKKIIVSFIAVCILVVIFDLAVFYTRCYRFSELNYTRKLKFSSNFFQQFGFRPYYTKMKSFQSKYNSLKFSDFKVENPNKNAILLFGCSFAHGFELELKETLSSKLSMYSNRNVYNRAVCGGGLKDFLFQSQLFYILKNYQTIKKVKPDIALIQFIENLGFDEESTKSFKRIFSDKRSYARIYKNYQSILEEQTFDYILYVFISDQTRRMHLNLLDPTENEYWSVYKLKNGLFSLQNTFFESFRLLSIPDFYKEQQVFRSMGNEKQKNLDLIIKYLSDSKNYIKNSFSKTECQNLKFVVVNYDTDRDDYQDNLKDAILDKDTKVINISNYLDDKFPNKKYLTDDNWHPSGVVWQEFVPKFIEEFNL